MTLTIACKDDGIVWSPVQQIHWPMGSSGRFQRFQTLHCYRKSVWQEVLRRSSCQTEMRIQHPHQPFSAVCFRGAPPGGARRPEARIGIRKARSLDRVHGGTELRRISRLGFCWASTAPLGRLKTAISRIEKPDVRRFPKSRRLLNQRV